MGAVREYYGDIGYIMKGKGKMISSLLRDEVAHSSAINKNVDWGMVEFAIESQGISTEDFVDTADLESCSHRTSVILHLGLGFHGEGSVYRAWGVDLRGCLGFDGDYSFPDCSGSSSMALMRGCCRLVRGQSRERCPVLRHRKHPPVLRRRSRSASVSFPMASRSMGTTPPGGR